MSSMSSDADGFFDVFKKEQNKQKLVKKFTPEEMRQKIMIKKLEKLRLWLYATTFASTV